MRHYLPYAAFWVAVGTVLLVTILVGCGDYKDPCQFGQWATDMRCK